MSGFDINQLTISGHLTRDPELRSTQGGTSICSLRIAHNERFKDAAGEWADRPQYFDVTVWCGPRRVDRQERRPGRQGRRRRPPALARVGRPERRRQAPGGRHHRRQRRPRQARRDEQPGGRRGPRDPGGRGCIDARRRPAPPGGPPR